MSADCVTSRPFAALPNAKLAFDVGRETPGRVNEVSDAPVTLNLSIHDRLESVEPEWRRFERNADCTPFQTFDWLLRWQRHIGARDAVQPAIAVGSFADGQTAFILPLGIVRSCGARRLCWLGQDLNDYNAPLVVREFSQRISAERFRAVWKELRTRMQREPLFRHDWIELEKMPQLVGGQLNPFFVLALATNPSGAHFAQLGDDWKKFYATKRSSATRRRDRAKRKRMAEFGEIGFALDADPANAKQTLEILMGQKRRLFAHRGIPDMFERPGWREFFLDLAEHASPLRASPLARDGKVLAHIGHTKFGEVRGATHLGVVFRDAYYHVLSSYEDGALAHYGPGALHLRELIANVIGLGLRRFDFTVGDEPYKLEWSDRHIKLGDYAAAATWRGVSAWGRSMVQRRIKRFIKQTPAAWRLVSRVRARIGPLLQRAGERS
jgi:CelD/BcsL family acetyltransferase involved in cellulose biosynthesis